MRWLIPWAACHVMLWCCLAWAEQPEVPSAPSEARPAEAPPPEDEAARQSLRQPTEPDSPPRSPSASRARVQEVRPPVYYVEDANGKLVPMFGFTFDDFMKAFAQIEGTAARAGPSGFTLRKMTAEGRVEADHVQLTVRLDLILHQEGVVRAPLRFDNAIVRGELKREGATDALLEFDRTDGYVCWIRGKAEEPVGLTLELATPLPVSGDEGRLRLLVPQATQSELRLTVPMSDAVGSVSEGSTLRTQPAHEGAHTEFVVEGLRGDFELTWHKPQVRTSKSTTVLEATGEIFARIDDHSVNTEATLRVKGFGEPFDRFRVRLPQGAELLSGNPSDYSISEVADDRQADDLGRIVEVELRKKTTDPITVRLATRREHEQPQSASWLELGGFEVLDAARQSGYIGVEVVGDLYVSWDPRLGVQQVEQLPDTVGGENLSARFEYFVQPCSLRARAVPRQTRVSVEPEYLLLVDPAQVQLEATLKYTVRGKKALMLEVAMDEWEFVEVGPDNLVAVDGVESGPSGLLTIPLSQPSSGQIELKLRARRPLDEKSRTLRLTLPQPRVTSPGPAAIVILPADNVHLGPDTQAITGLVLQEIAPPMKLPKRQQAPLFYRGEVAQAAFVAEKTVHAQTVAVHARSHVMLTEQAGQVQQRFSYKIDYEPLCRLAVEIPRALVGSKELEFQLDGQVLPPTAISEDVQPRSVDSKQPVRLHIALPSPRIGACELTVRYALTPCQLAPQSSIRREIPLVSPLDGQLSENRLVVSGPPELQITPPGGPWKLQTEGMSSDTAPLRQSGLEMIATERVGVIDLALHLEAKRVAGATVVQRAWIETWLTGTDREERALMRFTTDRDEVELILPKEADLSQVNLYLDGQPLLPKATTGNRWLLAMPESVAQRHRLLEVRYHSPTAEVSHGTLAVQFPRLGAQTWIRRLYWRVTLPPAEHILAVSPGFVREFHWGWNGVFWGRKPLLGQAELDAWIGASYSPETSEGANTYLFSTLGNVTGCEIRVASRAWIVLGASGAALAIGLLLIYVPACRHPATLLLAAVALAGAVMIDPEPTLLALQAASLGLALTLVAGILQRSLGRRRRGVIRLTTPSGILDKDSTQTQYPPSPGNAFSTETAMVHNPASPRDFAVRETPSGSARGAADG